MDALSLSRGGGGLLFTGGRATVRVEERTSHIHLAVRISVYAAEKLREGIAR